MEEDLHTYSKLIADMEHNQDPSLVQPFSVNATMMQHFEDGTLIGLPPESEDTTTTTLSTMCNVKTKFITGTKIDIARAHKELILLDTGANGSFSSNLRWIHNLKYFPTPQYAIVGDGFKCMVYGIG